MRCGSNSRSHLPLLISQRELSIDPTLDARSISPSIASCHSSIPNGEGISMWLSKLLPALVLAGLFAPQAFADSPPQANSTVRDAAAEVDAARRTLDTWNGDPAVLREAQENLARVLERE